jgi:hypothetical protein
MSRRARLVISAPAPTDNVRAPTRSRLWATLIAAACLVAVIVGGAAGATEAPDPSFAPSGSLVAGVRPCSVATADFNGDGKPDLAVGNCGSHDITVLLGDGAGGFRPAIGSPLKVGGSSFVVADFNGDGKADLAVGSNTSKDVTVLLGDGAGGFRVAAGSPITVAGLPANVTAADLNGDGKVDLVVPFAATPRVTILLGDGSGRFAPAPGSPLAIAGRYPLSAVAVADFNGDGKVDLAGVDSESDRISILLGDGAGGFSAGTTVRALLLAVADFNGDGHPDLAVANIAPDQVTLEARVLLGNGTGGFRPPAGTPIVVGPSEALAAVADFNGDHRPDLAVANRSSGVSILLGNGAGGLRPAVDSPFAAPSSGTIVAADLNGDGKADLALTGDEGLTILWQTQSTPAVARGRALPRQPDAVFSTRRPIERLAADGNRAAVVTIKIKRTPCGRVVVWTAPGPTSTSFKPGYLGCSGDGVGDVALGGGEVAWTESGGGNSLELSVMAAKLSAGAAKKIADAYNGDRAGGDPTGDWLGQLLGGGPLLAYNRWQIVCSHHDRVYHDCDGWAPAKKELVRLAAGRPVVVTRGADACHLDAVGGGRMAVADSTPWWETGPDRLSLCAGESAGAVTILAPNGSHVATVPAESANPPRAIALSKTRLAVLRTFTLDLYNPKTGTKLKSVPLGPAAGLQLAGINSKLALLRDSGQAMLVPVGATGGAVLLHRTRRLVLVRLSDGKLISLPLLGGTTTGVIDPRLTEAGLFYAYNVPRASSKGRIVFEAATTLLARF